MRKIVALIMVAGVMTFTQLAGAAEKQAKDGKDMCLLYMEDCPGQQPTIEQIIAKLKAEIKKGPAVYSKAELTVLKHKLANARALLNDIEFNP